MIRRIPLARLALGLLLLVGAGWALTHRDVLSLESIQPALRALGIWAPIAFILIYATATVLFFSGAILSLAGGALFGPVWGTAGIWPAPHSAQPLPFSWRAASPASGRRGGSVGGYDA